MKKILAIIALAVSSQTAQAGLLLEPYLGYEMGVSKATISQAYANANASGVVFEGLGKTEGTVIGARIGYKLPVMFWMALEPSMMTGKYKSTNNGFTDADATRTQLFIDAGMDFPILIRGWLGYALMNDWANKDSSGTATYKGSATKLGFGFTGLPLVSINLEYVTHNFTKVSGLSGAVSETVSDNFSATTNTSTVLSVSMPFNL